MGGGGREVLEAKLAAQAVISAELEGAAARAATVAAKRERVAVMGGAWVVGKAVAKAAAKEASVGTAGARVA